MVTEVDLLDTNDQGAPGAFRAWSPYLALSPQAVEEKVSATRHARAAVGGLISGLTGTDGVYVSGGAEHQGPPGGGPVVVIARI